MLKDIERVDRIVGTTVVKRMATPPNTLLGLAVPFSQDATLADLTVTYFNDETNRPIIIPSLREGLGDRIIQLRHTAGLARHFPHKTFVFWQDELRGIENSPYFSLPENVHPEPASSGGSITLHLYSPDIALQPFLSSYNSRLKNRPYNSRDVDVLIKIARNEGRINYNLFYEPIFKISPDQVENHPVQSDVLCLPDAIALPGQKRSRKSLSPETWGKVFSQMDPSQRLAIVIGTANPAYCHEVVRVAHEVGMEHVDEIEGDIHVVIDAILSTRKFVGMDSGTTHLAAEVIKAARAAGRTINFRELFLDSVFPFTDYGIPDVDGLFKTLVHYSGPSGDLDRIDPVAVAAFISS